MSILRAVLRAIDRDAEARRTLVPFKYLNYADTVQNPIASYGLENSKMLQDASRKYDPGGVFQKGVSGGGELFTQGNSAFPGLKANASASNDYVALNQNKKIRK